MQFASRANQTAEGMSRDLLVHLLPEEPFHISHLSRPNPKAKRDWYNIVASGIAYVSDALKFSNDWSENEDKRRQREKNFDDSAKARISNASKLLHVLDYEDLIPYYLDYKLRGLDYAYSKWSQTIPSERLRVRVANKDTEPRVFRINLRKVDDKEEKEE